MSDAVWLVLLSLMGGVTTLLTLSFTKRERAANAQVQEATAIQLRADAAETLMNQNAETQQRLIDTTKEFMDFVKSSRAALEASHAEQTAEREMYRARDRERDERHASEIKELKTSLTEAQESLIDTCEKLRLNEEKVTELASHVHKLSIELETRDRTIDSLNGRILQLEAAIIQAHADSAAESAAKDEEIARLKARVAELESKQQPTAIEATVTIVEPTIDADTQAVREILADLRKEPATTTPEPGKDGQPATLPVPPGDTAEDVPMDTGVPDAQ